MVTTEHGTTERTERRGSREAARLAAAAATRTADYEFFFDFDGTLSAIVADPEAAGPVPGAADALEQLAARAKRVTVVSGRPVAFLIKQLGDVPGLAFFGLYGLEYSLDGGATVATLPEAAPYEAVISELVAEARQDFPDLLIEDKRLSCSVHYRSDPAREDEVVAWAERQAEKRGLHLQRGRLVAELKPPVETDKGSVVLRTAPDAAGAWFFGDDLGDLPAFAALDRLAAERPGFAGVRVAVANAEGPGAVLGRHADLVLSGPEEVPAMLAAVLGTDRETLNG
jgi:trehalose 6-phosphate phosphatase